MVQTTMKRFEAQRPLWTAVLVVASVGAAHAQSVPAAQQPQSTEWKEAAPPLPPVLGNGQAPAIEPEETSPARLNEDQDAEEEAVDGAEDGVDVTVAPVQPQVPLAPPESAPTLEQFQDELSPYGTWINDPELGLVWQPSAAVVGTDFQPYVTGGSWVTTSLGWGFQSDWSWGWAPFHYGRWYRHARWGWLWWPQYAWAPAWVDWRTCGTHVAWAPLAPPGFRLGFGLGVPGWSFVSFGNFGRPGIAHYAYEPYRGSDGWGWRHFSGWQSDPWRHQSASTVTGGWNAPTSHGARPVGSGGSRRSAPGPRPAWGRTWSTTVSAPPPGRTDFGAPGSHFGRFSSGRSVASPEQFHGSAGWRGATGGFAARTEMNPPPFRGGSGWGGSSGGFGGRTQVSPPAFHGGSGWGGSSSGLSARTQVSPPAFHGGSGWGGSSGGFGGRTQVSPPAFHGGSGWGGSSGGFGGRTQVSPPAFHGGSGWGGGVHSGGGMGGFHGSGGGGGSHGGGGGRGVRR